MKKIDIAVAAALAGVAASTAVAQDAVQWRVEDGGNGHWYVFAGCSTGFSAEAVAASLHGYLVSISSAEENSFVQSALLNSTREFAMIGFIQADDQAAPGLGWGWASGEPVTYTNWTDFDGAYAFVAPDDRPCARGTGVEDNQCNQGLMYLDGRWDDVERGTSCAGFATSSIAIVEFSEDCNGDGIVDYGQILDGTYPDENGNGVPDCCDEGVGCDCPADITGDAQVDAADLGVLLAVWNTDGGTIPEADINGDGTVNASDLGLLLGSWGLCS